MKYFWKSSVLFALTITGCGSPNAAKLANSESQLDTLHFGDGYNTFSQTRARRCLDTVTMRQTAEGNGYKITSSVAMYSTAKEALSSLDGSASAHVGFIGVQLNANASFAKESLKKTFNIYIVTDVTVAGPASVVESPKLSAAYVNLLKRDPDRFFQECGMKYVSEATIGGTYRAIVRITSSSSEEKETVAATLTASGMSWNAKTELNSKKMDSLKQFESSIVQEQIGGVGEGATIPRDIAEIATRAQNFPNLINSATGRLINLKFKPYDQTLPIDQVRLVKVPAVEAAVDALSSAQSKLSQLKLNVEALDFILDDPSDFKGDDFAGDRKKVLTSIEDLTAQCTKCLESLTTCKISSVQEMDLSKYVSDRTVVTQTLKGQRNVFAGLSDRSDQDLWGHVIVHISGQLLNNTRTIYLKTHGTFEETGDTAHETHGIADAIINLYTAPDGWLIEKVVARTEWPDIVHDVMLGETKEKDFSGPEVPGLFHVRADRHGEDLPNFAGYDAHIEISDVRIYLKKI